MNCSEMSELLTDVSPELVEEFSQDFFAGRGRRILHDSKRWRVLDTWVGTPPELSRQVKQPFLVSAAVSTPEPLTILRGRVHDSMALHHAPAIPLAATHNVLTCVIGQALGLVVILCNTHAYDWRLWQALQCMHEVAAAVPI